MVDERGSVEVLRVVPTTIQALQAALRELYVPASLPSSNAEKDNPAATLILRASAV